MSKFKAGQIIMSSSGRLAKVIRIESGRIFVVWQDNDRQLNYSLSGSERLWEVIEEPPDCNHEFVEYVGLREAFYFCKLCDEKKTIKEIEEYWEAKFGKSETGY